MTKATLGDLFSQEQMEEISKMVKDPSGKFSINPYQEIDTLTVRQLFDLSPMMIKYTFTDGVVPKLYMPAETISLLAQRAQERGKPIFI